MEPIVPSTSPDGNRLCKGTVGGRAVTLTIPVGAQRRILDNLIPRLFETWVQQRNQSGILLTDYTLDEREVDGLLSDLFATERRRVAGQNL